MGLKDKKCQIAPKVNAGRAGPQMLVFFPVKSTGRDSQIPAAPRGTAKCCNTSPLFHTPPEQYHPFTKLPVLSFLVLFSFPCPHTPPSQQSHTGEAASSSQAPVWGSGHSRAVGKSSHVWHMTSSPTMTAWGGIFGANLVIRTGSLRFSPHYPEKERLLFFPQQFLVSSSSYNFNRWFSS